MANKINARKKGASGERELANVLSALTGQDCSRVAYQYGNKDAGDYPDVAGLDGLHIECKRVEKLNIDTAYEQSVRDAKEGEIPVVMHRKNRKNGKVTLSIEDFCKMYNCWNNNE